MFISNFTLLLLALVAGVNCKPMKSEDKEMKWPEKYHLEVTKYDILSDITEDIKVWRTGKEARVEYNSGAVKTFVTTSKGYSRRGVVYEIHPETYSDKDVNEIVCHQVHRGRFSIDEIQVLPDADQFEEVGYEQMKDKNCTVFAGTEDEEGVGQKQTLWAYYDEKADGWVPVRYDVQKYESELGSINRHDLWEFEGFDSEFDDKVFDPSEYCNQNKRAPIKHKLSDKEITRHLRFIDPENEEHVKHVFKHFKKDFNKKYAHEEEHEMRKRIFKKNLRLIKSANRKNLPYKLAVNQFADRTPEEMKRHMGLMKRPEGKHGLQFPYTEEKLQQSAPALPAAYDLRLEGVISPVLNQESCGSCWTFGTTSAIEGAIARSNGGKMIRLSNQALIDCAWEFGAGGCDGGTDNAAYEWTMKYGLPTIADYGTYQNQDDYCHIENITNTHKIKGYVDVTPTNVGALKTALINHGPLSVSVHVTSSFQLYNSGVFYDFECDPTELNHEITLVGYGQEFGEDYWIIKNSWGPNWGIDGYMHIAVKDNNCGIMTEPTYVIL